MPTRTFPPLYRVNFGQILELVRDLKYFRRDYQIILAVDCADLIDYCYPINPTDQQREIDPEYVAESQVALNQLFRVDDLERLPLILLPEYRAELLNFQDSIRQEAGRVYKDAEIISQMIKLSDLEDITSEQQGKLDRIVQKRFQFLLTVLLGMYSSGSKRLKEIYNTRLTLQVADAIQPEDRRYFTEYILNRYTPSHLRETIFQALEKSIPDPRERAKREQANRNDASAIDRLIYLNTEAERAAQSGLLKHQYLFLYISTSQRRRGVFALSDVKKALPPIRGQRYSFLRDRHQIFTYILHRSLNPDARQRAIETGKELKELSRVLRKVEKFKRIYESESNDCRACILDGKTPASCRLADFCRDVQAAGAKIKERKEEVNNLRLLNQIDSYKNLLNADVTFFGSKVYLELFRDVIYETNRYRDFALEGMYQRKLSWISRTSEGTGLFSHIREKELNLRSEIDPITNIVQYLPSKPHFTSAAYKEIIKLILDFYREPRRIELVDDAYHKFINLEPDSKQEDEYDLLKCYLYLAFGFEEKLHSYLSALLKPKLEKDVSDVTRRECLYVLCWSARRSGLNQDANRYAKEGIARYPEDPRFYHGLALNIYTWQKLDAASCRYQIIDIVENSQRAVELYQRHAQENKDVIAACYNNMAYFLALDAKTGNYDRAVRTQKLEEARACLEQLKDIFNKETAWNPDHPEFFHTSAFLEYQEVIHYWTGQERDKEELKKKLRSANEDIELVLDLYNGPKAQELENEELKNEIDDFYQKMVSGIIK